MGGSTSGHTGSFSLDAGSVAVVGASPDDNKIGGKPMRFLREFGFAGKVYPVNPRHHEIRGFRCYRDLASIEGRIDTVVVAVPYQHALPVISECARLGVAQIVMFSSGYAEVGAEGARRQDELKRLLKGSRTRLLGPNALGIANLSSGFIANFSQAFELPRNTVRSGRIGFISQSGAFGTFIFALSVEQGLGFKYFVATGNEADVTLSEVIEAMSDDQDIDVIAGYVEGVRDGRRFLDACERARQVGKAVVLIKTGRTPGGSAAAMSHTAAIAGADEVYDAVFRQAGVARINDEEEMLDTLAVLAAQRKMQGRRVGVLTMSGGAGVLIADALEREGLVLAELAPATEQALSEIVPEFGSVRNPVDLTGQFLARPEMLQAALASLLADTGVDAVLVFLGLGRRYGAQIAQTLQAAMSCSPKPLLVSWVAGPASIIKQLREQGLPVLPGATRAVRSLGVLAYLHEAATRRPDAAAHPMPLIPAQRLRASGSDGRCSEAQAKALLRRYGFQLLDEALVTSEAQAVAHAQRVGFPVALKICAADVLHKSDIGGVALAIQNADELVRAYRNIYASVRSAVPDLVIEGVLVSPMAPDGVELILGARRDPIFGPILMIGAGGIHAELFHDLAIGLLPLSRTQAERLIQSLRIAPLLGGSRGQLPADIDALVTAMLALSDIIREHDEISELEINPLRIRPRGAGALPLDALLVLAS